MTFDVFAVSKFLVKSDGWQGCVSIDADAVMTVKVKVLRRDYRLCGVRCTIRYVEVVLQELYTVYVLLTLKCSVPSDRPMHWGNL